MSRNPKPCSELILGNSTPPRIVLFPLSFLLTSYQPGGSLSPETKFNLILVFRGLVQFQAHMQYLVTKPCLHLKRGHLSGPSFPHLMHVYYCLNLASTIIHKASQRVTSALPIPTSSESVLFRADYPQTCYVVEEGLELLFACLYLPSSKITSLCHLSGFMWC